MITINHHPQACCHRPPSPARSGRGGPRDVSRLPRLLRHPRLLCGPGTVPGAAGPARRRRRRRGRRPGPEGGGADGAGRHHQVRVRVRWGAAGCGRVCMCMQLQLLLQLSAHRPISCASAAGPRPHHRRPSREEHHAATSCPIVLTGNLAFHVFTPPKTHTHFARAHACTPADRCHCALPHPCPPTAPLLLQGCRAPARHGPARGGGP